MNVDAHGRVKWFLGGSLWCGVLGTKKWILACGGVWAPKALFWHVGPSALGGLSYLTLAWHFGSMTLEVFWSS